MAKKNLFKKIGKLLLAGILISIIFTFIDFWYHYLIPQFTVEQPFYSINKFLITPILFIISIFMFRKIKSQNLRFGLMALGVSLFDN